MLFNSLEFVVSLLFLLGAWAGFPRSSWPASERFLYFQF